MWNRCYYDMYLQMWQMRLVNNKTISEKTTKQNKTAQGTGILIQANCYQCTAFLLRSLIVLEKG